MARKRFLLFSTIQPILKHRFGKTHRQITAFFLALFTLISTLIFPVLGKQVVGRESQHPQTFLISQASYALELEQKGKDSYNTGRFAEASKLWQQAADAYGKDEDNKNKNLIYKAKALQSLGLYPEACNQLIKVLTTANFTCEPLITFLPSEEPRRETRSLEEKLEENLLKDIKPKQNPVNKIIGLRLFGELLQRLGNLTLSQKILVKSLEASEKYPKEKSATLLALGNIERAIGNKKRDRSDSEKIGTTIQNNCDEKKTACDKTALQIAKETYKDAFKYYDDALHEATMITKIQAELNQLSLLIEIQEWWTEKIHKTQKVKLPDPVNWPELPAQLNHEIIKLLSKIECHLENLPQSREAVYAQINFTHNLIRFNTNKDYSQKEKDDLQKKIDKVLNKAIQQAQILRDKQAESEALSNLARLYEFLARREKQKQQERFYLYTQAKDLIQQALRLSDDVNIDNRQVLYRQRQLLGQILKAQGNIEGALESYAEAWNILESLREDLVTNTDNQFSFRQNVEPVYREFIDLLLQPNSSKVDLQKLVLRKDIRGADNRGKEDKYQNIEIARLVMESLQLAELDNYLEEPCSPPVAKPVQIDKIDDTAAVIYPIILENRLEVILDYMEDKQSNKLDKQSNKSRALKNYPNSINQKEVKDTLEDLANIIYSKEKEDSAFVLVRTRFDEDQKLDEDKKRPLLSSNKEKILPLSQNLYNWIIKPLEEQLTQSKIETLVFVLDRPFQRIPIAALYDGKQYLVEKYNIVLSLGQQLIEPKSLKPENALAAGVSKERTTERGQHFRSIGYIQEEFDNIKNSIKSTEILLDEKFTKNAFQAKIKSFHTVVHLAAHGVFSSNPEETFILTGDSSITINEFQTLLNPNKYRLKNKAIELLVLSACETALGDERAALGIAGVVVRSGASSTVATLWSVLDEATATLMEKFYHNLVKKKMSIAKALRCAQKELLNDKKYNHPYYWAPFVLVRN